VIARCVAAVHLTGVNDLAIARQQIEVRTAVLGLAAVEVPIDGGIFLYGSDAVLAALLGGVALAGEDDLPIACLEVELKAPVCACADDEGAHDRCFWVSALKVGIYDLVGRHCLSFPMRCCARTKAWDS
jgi:hypothetical protein